MTGDQTFVIPPPVLRNSARMEREMCFICGMTISRGNRSEVTYSNMRQKYLCFAHEKYLCNSAFAKNICVLLAKNICNTKYTQVNQSKMDKLVSVQRTVDHSSTIICDILSRILNETVMGEESVCRLCFNLLNDIDYHLKEAQEKTDEITAKFLDKEKDLIRYNPEPKVTDSRKKEKKERKHHSASAGVVSRTIQTEIHSQQSSSSLRPRSPSHVPVKGGGKGQSFFKSPERVPEKSKSPKKKHSPSKSGGGDDSDDEMSEKKRKLLSRVLAPAKRSRHPSSGYDEEERKLTIDMEEEMLRKIRKKEKKMKKREKKRKMQELEERLKESHDQEIKNEKIVPDVEESDHEHNDFIEDISDTEEAEGVSPNTSQADYTSPNKTKSEDIRTVDLSQLGDLFSEYPPNSSAEAAASQVFAKKSIPTQSQQQQLLQQQLLQQQQQQQAQQQQQQVCDICCLSYP